MGQNGEILKNVVANTIALLLTNRQILIMLINVLIYFMTNYMSIETEKLKCTNSNEHNNNIKYPQWFSVDLMRKIRYKNRLHKHIQQGKTSVFKCDEYRKLRHSVKKQVNFEFLL